MSSTWASVVPAGELVDQGQRPPAGHSRRHGTDQQFSHPVSSLTRASDARDARRSHRSVEGDEKPHKMRERHRQTATKPRYYIRGIEITAQTGLGRFLGGAWPRQRLRAPSSCRPHGPRSCHLARYPRTTPAISTASLPVLSRRFRADPHEVGRIEGIGPDLWKPVSSSTMTSTSRAAPVSS